MSEHEHSSSRGRLSLALTLTCLILLAEITGAILTGSLALLVDAAHVLTDVGGLLLALFTANLSRKPANARRTWGFGRAEVLSATGQAMILLGMGIFVLIEGVRRLFHPPVIASTSLAIFGAIGLAGNLLAIAVLLPERSHNFNLRAAFLETINDALGSAAVLIAAATIAITGWTRADAVVAILIGLLILPRTIKLLWETMDVLLESTPRGLNLESIRTHILEIPRVISVHDLHATQISTGLPVLTAHVVVDDDCFFDGHASSIIDELQLCVAEHFDVQIEHSTFQLESSTHSNHEYKTHQ